MKKNRLAFSIALAFLGYVSPTLAQSGGDLQAAKPPQPIPSDATALPSTPPAVGVAPTLPAGPEAILHSVEISGNRDIATEVLLSQLGRIEGLSLDMAGLNRLANTLANYYRAAGFPFAQAYLPPQDLKNGILHINIIEGTYGTVRAAGPADLVAGAQPFLEYGLKHGDTIQNQALERTMLILDDQPGMKVGPVIKPGGNQGEADLVVNVERSSYVSGEVGVDNTGATSTGEYRLHGAVDVNSPFMYGDKISLNAMTTNENMWLGSVNYELPLGASGLRGAVGYAHTNYQLGAQFSALNAVGYADIATARLSYPLIRSQATNLLLSAGLQHKELEDDYRTAGTIQKKRSDAFPVTLQFDKRDTLLGGGVTYGSLNWTPGKLDLDQAMSVTDAASARTQGYFNKFNLDVARIQSVVDNFTLYGRFSGQWADKNLDPSEKFNLGGYYGVRAYPLGEGMGDSGWFTQLELRYAMGEVTPFVFYDVGESHSNINPWDANSGAVRKLSGSGLGLRSIHGAWSLDATVAWQTSGGASTVDNGNRNPRAFFMLGYRF